MNLRAAVAVVVAVTCFSPKIARAVCGYDTPAVQQSVTDEGLDPNAVFPPAHTLTGSASVTCTITGTPPNPPGGTNDNWSVTQTLVYANAKDFEVEWVRGSGRVCTSTPADGYGLSGNRTCPYDSVSGVHAVLKVQATCGGQCGYHIGEYVYSSDIVIPPRIEELTNADIQMIFPYPSGKPSLNGSVTIDTIPVGYPFSLWGAHANPATGDTFTIHVEGAGIAFSHAYGPKLRASDGQPQDVGFLWYEDTASAVTATQEGEIQFWAELNGVKSVVRTLHAVNWVGGNAPGQQGTGGGSGSSNTGGGSGSSDSPSGCNTTGVSLLALLPLFFRRRG